MILKSAPEGTLRSYFNDLQQKRPKPVRYAAMVSFFKTLIHVNSRLTSEMILQLKKDDRWPAMYAIRDASPRGSTIRTARRAQRLREPVHSLAAEIEPDEGCPYFQR